MFVLKPLGYEDLDRIYRHDEEPISKFAYPRHLWPTSVYGWNWVVDEAADAFLLRVPLTRSDTHSHHIFGLGSRVAILRKESYGLYSFAYLSSTSAEQLKDIQERIRTAFRIAGHYIDGTTDANSVFAVPNAQFVV